MTFSLDFQSRVSPLKENDISGFNSSVDCVSTVFLNADIIVQMAELVLAPSEVLRTVAKPVKVLDKRVLDVLSDMEKVLKAAKDPQGVGLAAPQIGVSLRIFMARPTKNGPITTFINPEIIKFSQKTNKPTSKNGVYEGCLSIPSHYSPITRSMSVTIRYQTPVLRTTNYELITETGVFTGFPAHVIQHEMDHLNGILFIDRCLEQNTKLFKIVGEEWEEVGI